MKKTFRMLINVSLHLLISIVIIGFSFLASYVFFLWSGYPPGGDAAQHLSRLTYVFTFPFSFNWFHVWAGGMPQFLWYPSVPYLLLSFIIRITSLPPGLMLNISAVVSAGLTAIAIYFLVYSVVKSKTAGLVSVVFFLSSPASYILHRASVYARQMALPFLVFSFAFFVRFWKRSVLVHHKDGPLSFSKIDYVGTVFFLGLVLVSHLAMGVTAIGLIVLGGLFIARSLRKFLAGFMKIIIPALFLSTAFWLPLLFYPISGFWTGKDVLLRPQVTEPWSNLFYFFDPSFIYFFEPNPFILPFFLLGGVFVFGLMAIWRRKKLLIDRFEKRLAIAFFFLAAMTIFYVKVTFQLLASFYSNIWPAPWVLLFSVIFLSLLAGVLFSWAISSKILRAVMTVFLIALCLGWMQTQFPIEDIPHDTPYHRIEANRDREFYNFVSRTVVPDAHQFNFRFGTGNFGHMARWFNVQYPFVPQTREYFYNAVVNPGSYFHLIQAVWNTPENYPETDFLLDWWGVKQFIVGDEDSEEEVPGKFSNKPESYRLIDRFNYKGPYPLYHRYDAYEFQGAGPILSTTNVATVLVIGRKETSYNTIFRSLSYANINSKMIIPLEGSQFIDDYKLAELKKFSTVFLYDYRYRSFRKANKLLEEYVSNGGRLIIEENKDVSSDKLLTVAPVLQVKREEREGDWQFSGLDELKTAGFDRPLLDGGPWAVIVADELKKDASFLIKSFDQPILVSYDYGQGKVIWSGMNLPFHVIYYQNQTESEYFSLLLGIEGVSQQAREGVSGEAVFVNPQERRLMVTGDTKGVLFKEFYFPNWHAYASQNELKIHQAGPGFMYLSLPKEFSRPFEVVFRYEKSLIERLSFFISGLSLIVFCLYSLEGKFFPPVASRFLKVILIKASRIANKVGSWWDREEE